MKLGSKYDLLDTPTTENRFKWSINESFKRSWLHKEFTVSLYSLDAVFVKLLSSKPCHFVKNIFAASSFFMHIFNMFVKYLQSVEKIQWKL